MGPEGVGCTSGALVPEALLTEAFVDEPAPLGVAPLAQPASNNAAHDSAAALAMSFMSTPGVEKVSAQSRANPVGNL